MGLATSEVETSSVSRTVPLDCAECQVSSSRGSQQLIVLSVKGQGKENMVMF